MLPAPSGDGGFAPCFLLSETGALCPLAQAPRSWHDGCWHWPVPATRGDCDGCRRRQILAAYSYFFQQLVFWGRTNVSVSLLFECAGGVAPGLHFPSRAKDRLKLQAFTAAQAYMKGEGDLGCHGGLAPASGGFLWAQQCTLALGFFGTCEGPEARVEMLLCRTAPPGFPCCSWAIHSSLIPSTQWEVKGNFIIGFWSSGLLGGVLQPPCPALGTWGSPGEVALPVVCRGVQVPRGAMLRPHPNPAPGLAQGGGKQRAEDARHPAWEPQLVKI